MKNLPSLGGGLIVLLAIMAFTPIQRSFNPVKTVQFISTLPVELTEIKLEAPDFNIDFKNHEAFLEAIGFRESGNRYDVVNPYGYMGRYQFGKSTLRGLGIKTTKTEFLNDPELQEAAMQELLLHNREKLHKLIEEYEGEIIHGVKITESGVLAAAHLGGAGNVRNWFRKGEDFKDGNGTPITKYMKVFSGYSLELE